MPGKLKKFCGLSKYLKTLDKELYQALDDLCLLGLFNTRNRSVTLLYPSDKSYRKKIVNMAYSNTPEKAVDMVKALLLADHFTSCKEFEKKKDDIPNFLRKRVEIASTSEKEVKLKSGHKLEFDKAYIPLRTGEQAAVYKLSGKGELPVTGPPSTGKYMSRARGGGGDGKPCELKDIAKFIERKFSQDDKMAYSKALACIYNTALVEKEDNTLIDYVYKNLCATEIATFYNVLKPYASSSPSDDATITTLSSKLKDMCNTDNWSKFNTDECVKKHKENRDSIIKAARDEIDDYDLKEKLKIRLESQRQILRESKTSTDIMDKIKAAYKKEGLDNLNKDLLSIYCYLTIIQDTRDNEDFKNCFCPAMEFLFNDGKIDTAGATDIANSLTLYGGLLKSDAFMYIPTCSDESLDDTYKDLGSKFPDPGDLRTLFTIEKNEVKCKLGGNSINVESFIGS